MKPTVPTVLSFENAKSWSWGNAIHELIDRLPDYRFIRIRRHAFSYQNQSGAKQTVMAPLDEGLLEFFDVTLMQNLDSIGLAEGCHEKIVARIGGLILNGKTDPFRYDKQLAKVGAVIACNDELHGIGAHANANCTMIPNGVDLEQFKPAEVRGDRPFTVGFVGNIWGAQAANYKGWPFYVQAVEIELALENIDRRNLLHDLPEQKPHEEMPDYFQNIDCLVMPSEGEGCSNTIKEALACGVPVLCTKVGFHGERLTDGENVIFIQRDGKDIAAKILMLKNDAALQEKLRFNGRLFAENNHDIRVIANAYDKVFRSVLEQNN